MEINNNGIIYKIEPQTRETNEMLTARGWYISKKSPMDHSQFLKYNRLSIFWANVIFLDCTYPPSIMKQFENDLPPIKEVKPNKKEKFQHRKK